MKISKRTAIDLIKGSRGKFIGGAFIKKNGDLRIFSGRVGVYKSKFAPLKGVGLAYKPADYGLVNYFDAQKKNYRMININTLQKLKLNKNTYEVGDE